MIDATLSLEAAEGLKGSDLVQYLLLRGWVAKPSRIDGVSILIKEGHQAESGPKLILPMKSGFVEERRRVADALRAVAQMEGRSETDVAEEVRQQVIQANAAPEIEVASPRLQSTRGRLPDLLSDDEIEREANRLRESLGLHEGPIFNIVLLLETKMPSLIRGFRMEIFTRDQKHIEAFSRTLPPRLYLRKDIHSLALRDDPRTRFTVAHELGHLWLHARHARLHRGGDVPSSMLQLRKQEEEARRFAAAFLMPSELASQFSDPALLSEYCNVTVDVAMFRLKVVYRSHGGGLRTRWAREASRVLAKVINSVRFRSE